MNEPTTQFEDPALKSALKRVCGAHPAPAELKNRILANLARSADAPHIRLPLWKHPAIRLVIAACTVVAVAGLIYHTIGNNELHMGIKHDVVMAMLRDHDGYCQTAAKNTAPADQALLVRTLGQKLRRPILAPNLADDGWRFEGGGVCSVKGQESARLVFSRGQQQLSIYSMAAPSRVVEATRGFRCEQAHDHVMASVTTASALYCAVGHCPAGNLREDEVRQILEKHQGDVVEVASALGGS